MSATSAYDNMSNEPLEATMGSDITNNNVVSLNGLHEANNGVSLGDDDDDVIPCHTNNWSEEKKVEYADYVKNQHLEAEPVMKEGMQVLLDNGKAPQFVTLNSKGDFRTRTGRASHSQLIGFPFQNTFSIEGRNLKVRERGALTASDVFEHLSRSDPSFLPSANNADLVDDTLNQTLTEADIRKMKSEGKSGDEIIRAVAAASKTFDTKTEFSQEKWFKRKAAKYNTDITISRPTPQAVLQFMIEKDHRRICYLRDDSLAQMIQKANIGAGSRAIVFDTVGGLVTASVAYRMGGFGKIFAPFVGLSESSSFSNRMNLSKAERAIISHIPISEMFSFETVNECVNLGVSKEDREEIMRMNAEFIAKHDDSTQIDGLEPQNDLDDDSGNAEDEKNDTEAAEQDEGQTSSDGFRRPPTKHAVQRRKLLEKTRVELKEGATSLIMCTSHSPLEILLPLLNFVLPSSPFVVYCTTPEPLGRVQNFLVQRKLAANVQIVEYWYRPMQILPNRTHPLMTTSATGGYILSGFTVAQ